MIKMILNLWSKQELQPVPDFMKEIRCPVCRRFSTFNIETRFRGVDQKVCSICAMRLTDSQVTWHIVDESRPGLFFCGEADTDKYAEEAQDEEIPDEKTCLNCILISSALMP